MADSGITSKTTFHQLVITIGSATKSSVGKYVGSGVIYKGDRK
jgi:hypothetical protein